MFRILSSLLLIGVLGACSSSNPDSLPNRLGRKIHNDTVKVENKTEDIVTRTGEKIQRTGEKVSHKIHHVGEEIEGDE